MREVKKLSNACIHVAPPRKCSGNFSDCACQVLQAGLFFLIVFSYILSAIIPTLMYLSIFKVVSFDV